MINNNLRKIIFNHFNKIKFYSFIFLITVPTGIYVYFHNINSVRLPITIDIIILSIGYLLGYDWLFFLDFFKSIILRNNDSVTFFSNRHFNYSSGYIYNTPGTQRDSNRTFVSSTNSYLLFKGDHLFVKDEKGDIQFVSIDDIKLIH
jgi:hypothetical protein